MIGKVQYCHKAHGFKSDMALATFVNIKIAADKIQHILL
jgi:hypothetical protein